MSEPAAELLSKLASLPIRDRADIAYLLLESLDPASDADWDEVWADELERREEMIRLGQATETPAEQVVSRLREKYS